ncbi:MAG: peptidylprolyl isomerase [candidate division Zixibacteria bacterium]|nr:peptidylprolyl isomerase [candidate division Zixibacteria bacterium]
MTSDSTDTGTKADAEVKYEAPIRNASNHIVKLTTAMGDLTLELFRDISPNHADSFLARVKDSFYVGTIFHRVITNFMIQGGDPTGTGSGDASYNLNAEFNDITHERGILSMARSNDPNSASCQFFVVHKKSAHLDGKYTVFGNLLAGYETLDKIATAKHKNTRPITEIKILKTSVIK